MERDCESELSKLNIEQNACIYHFGASVIHGQRSNILRLPFLGKLLIFLHLYIRKYLYYSSKSVAIYQVAIKQERMSSNILSHLHNKISPFLFS